MPDLAQQQKPEDTTLQQPEQAQQRQEIVPIHPAGKQTPMKWDEVENSEKFQSLPEIEKAAVQQEYFNNVIAPKVSPDDPLEEVRKEFLDTYPRVSRQRGRSWAKSPEAYDIVNVSRVLGVDPKNVDVETGGKFLERLDYSLSDTDEEVANKFGRRYPNGTMARITMPDGNTRLVYRENLENKWKTVEDYGVSLGDIADVGGEIGMMSASMAAGLATGGSSVVVQMLAYGGGYAGGFLMKEASEELRGTQLQPGEEVALEAGEKFAEAGIGAGIAAGVSKLGTMALQRGIAGGGKEVSQLMQDVIKAKESGLETEELMMHQAAPERMILQRFGAQAEFSSKGVQKKLATQKSSALQALKNAKTDGPTEYEAGKQILRETKKIYNQEYNRLVNEIGRSTPRQTQEALQGSILNFIANTKKDVGNLYRNLDIIAEKELPIFDLGKAKTQVNKIKNAVIGAGKPITKEMEAAKEGGYGFAQTPTKEVVTEAGPGVQVADTPQGRLIGIINDIDNLSTVQSNYNVVKQLRTRTGDLLENIPWQDNINRKYARELYGVLSDILKNPVNKTKAYPKAVELATAKAKARYDVLDKASIQTIVNSENAGELILKLSKPNTLTPDIMNVLKSRFVKSGDLNTFKTGILDQILLDEKGAVNAIKQFRAQTGDPEAWRFLVPKSKEIKIENIAKQIDKLNDSNIGYVARSKTKEINAVNELLLKKGTSKADIDNIVNAFSSKGNFNLRHAIYEDIINKSKTEIKNVLTIDPKKLGNVLADYEKSGIWERVLTKEDRIKLKGLKAYVNLIFRRGTDPGTSLEVAQAITNLKHPATFFNGVHQLSVNSAIGKILMSKWGSKLLVGSTTAQVHKEPLIITEAVVNGLLEGTEPGSGTSAKEQLLY